VPLQELSDAERSGATFEVEQVIVPGLYAERCLIVGRPYQR
jgi:hypothetical protein